MLIESARRKAIAKQKQSGSDTKHNKVLKTEYDKWMGKLRADQKAVKEPSDHGQRNRIAAQKVDLYLDYLRDYLARGKREQNDVLTQNVVWATDGERWDVLFELADPAISDPKMGNLHWRGRPLITFVSDQVLKFAEASQRSKQPIKAPVKKVLDRLMDGRWTAAEGDTRETAILKIVQARYHRLLGLEAQNNAHYKVAATHYAYAYHLKNDIGVKGRLETMLKKLGIERDKKDENGETQVRSLADLLTDINIVSDKSDQ